MKPFLFCLIIFNCCYATNELFFVKVPNSDYIVFPLDPNITISMIKNVISSMENLQIDKQIIIYKNKLLNDKKTLAEYDVTNNAILNLYRIPDNTNEFSIDEEERINPNIVQPIKSIKSQPDDEQPDEKYSTNERSQNRYPVISRIYPLIHRLNEYNHISHGTSSIFYTPLISLSFVPIILFMF